MKPVIPVFYDFWAMIVLSDLVSPGQDGGFLCP